MRRNVNTGAATQLATVRRDVAKLRRRSLILVVSILVSNTMAIVKMLRGVGAKDHRSFLIAWCLLLVATTAALVVNAQLRFRVGELSKRALKLAHALRGNV